MKRIIVFIFTLLNLSDLFSQTAEEFYSKALDEQNANTKISLFQKALKLDNKFIEPNFRLAEYYDHKDIVSSKEDSEKAKKYYQRCIDLLTEGISLKGIDTKLRERTFYRELASTYLIFAPSKERYDKNDIKFYIKSIEYYEKALEHPYDSTSYYGLGPDFESDFEITSSIADQYRNIARIEKFNKDYYSAMDHLNIARQLYQSIKYYDFIYEMIDHDLDINYLLLRKSNWQVLYNYESLQPGYHMRELISTNNYLYFYNMENIEKLENNTLRVWLLRAKLGKKEEINKDDIAEQKTLIEFDLKNKKYRELKYIFYNIEEVVLNDYTPEESKWDFIAPDTLYEDIIKYFIDIYGKKSTKK